MIGIATVARPDDDGIRNDSGRNSRYITIANAASPTSPSARLGPVQDGVGDLAVVHDDGDAAGDADDQRDAEEVRAPSTNVVVSSPSLHPADDADQDREQAGTTRSSPGTTTTAWEARCRGPPRG